MLRYARLEAHSACVHVHVCMSMCMCACALPLCLGVKLQLHVCRVSPRSSRSSQPPFSASAPLPLPPYPHPHPPPAHTQSKELHQKALSIALDKFGVAHATTTLARGNLVDALDQLGEREEARALLNDSVASIQEVKGGALLGG